MPQRCAAGTTRRDYAPRERRKNAFCAVDEANGDAFKGLFCREQHQSAGSSRYASILVFPQAEADTLRCDLHSPKVRRNGTESILGYTRPHYAAYYASPKCQVQTKNFFKFLLDTFYCTKGNKLYFFAMQGNTLLTQKSISPLAAVWT